MAVRAPEKQADLWRSREKSQGVGVWWPLRSCFRKAWGPCGRGVAAGAGTSSDLPARALGRSSPPWAAPGSGWCLLPSPSRQMSAAGVLRTPRSGKARAAGAPARRAADSCCSAGRRRAARARGRGWGAERPGAEGGASCGSGGLQGAELAWLQAARPCAPSRATG